MEPTSGGPPESPEGAPGTLPAAPPTPRPGGLRLFRLATPRAAVAVGLLLLVVALVGGLGAWQLGRTRDRVDRLAIEVRRTRADINRLREELGAIQTKVGDIAGTLPPDVPALVDTVKGSVVTVELPGHGIGSGFAIEAGLPPGFRTAILTSEHVVHSAVVDRRVAVLVTQGTSTFRARLGKRDEQNDLALLFVKPELTPIPWSSEEGHEPRVGELVVAIGSPLGLELSTTVGVISKLFFRVIQTDAAINPGNSGGPLLNRYGEVVGINTFSLRGVNGLGYANRIERACEVLVKC